MSASFNAFLGEAADFSRDDAGSVAESDDDGADFYELLTSPSQSGPMPFFSNDGSDEDEAPPPPAFLLSPASSPARGSPPRTQPPRSSTDGDGSS